MSCRIVELKANDKCTLNIECHTLAQIERTSVADTRSTYDRDQGKLM